MPHDYDASNPNQLALHAASWDGNRPADRAFWTARVAALAKRRGGLNFLASLLLELQRRTGTPATPATPPETPIARPGAWLNSLTTAWLNKHPNEDA